MTLVIEHHVERGTIAALGVVGHAIKIFLDIERGVDALERLLKVCGKMGFESGKSFHGKIPWVLFHLLIRQRISHRQS